MLNDECVLASEKGNSTKSPPFVIIISSSIGLVVLIIIVLFVIIIVRKRNKGNDLSPRYETTSTLKDIVMTTISSAKPTGVYASYVETKNIPLSCTPRLVEFNELLQVCILLVILLYFIR